MIRIDGSFGEGGGQVLRTSLTLALMTGKPMTIINIRAGRPRPGLQPQHLKAVQGAAAVGNARTHGARLRSRTLVFEPGKIEPGDFHFDIGTAGSTALVLQTVLLPLHFAGDTSSVTVTGGTHVPWSPCFHYLDSQWRGHMQEIGYDIDLRLGTAGFYPQGGGCIKATIHPATALSPLRIVERGHLKRIRGISATANLDPDVSERQKQRAMQRLSHYCADVQIEDIYLRSRFKGTLLLLLAQFESSQSCYYGLGKPGKPAECVADKAVDALEQFLAGDGAVDQYLGDQLMLPLALVPGVSELRVGAVTQHMITNAEIIKMFLPAKFEINGKIGQAGTIRVKGVSTLQQLQ